VPQAEFVSSFITLTLTDEALGSRASGSHSSPHHHSSKHSSGSSSSSSSGGGGVSVSALGCGATVHGAKALNAELAFVDAPNFERGDAPLSSWVDQWTGLNGDM